MTRINLRLYVNPGEAEVTFSLQLQDQTYERVTGTVDTGAEVSLLPNYLLHKIGIASDEQLDSFIIDQAGIANQSFSATPASVNLFLEDSHGNRTGVFEVPVWFADTEIALIGFAGILDRSILHIDMPQRIGWLEIDA